jgi:LysM repeat protein
VSSANSNRRSGKFRYRGRHAAPSQSQKIAAKAAKAAPVIAIAGVVVGAPQFAGVANAATTAAVGTASAVHTVPAASATRATRSPRVVHATLDAVTTSDGTYEVQPGDTLSGIADQFYGSYGDWQWLYNQNTATISDPNLIYPGQVLNVPSGGPSGASQQQLADSGDSSASSDSATSGQASNSSSAATESASTTASDSAASTDSASTSDSSGSLSGTLGCSGLEALWDAAGGNPANAVMAAEIAMAESGGNQYAVSSTDDIGYWQINEPTWGSLATFDPVGNAQAAIQISDDGADWEPWTTYQTGAYYGQC